MNGVAVIHTSLFCRDYIRARASTYLRASKSWWIINPKRALFCILYTCSVPRFTISFFNFDHGKKKKKKFNKALRASEGICRKLLGDNTSQKTHTHVYAKRQGKKKKKKEHFCWLRNHRSPFKRSSKRLGFPVLIAVLSWPDLTWLIKNATVDKVSEVHAPPAWWMPLDTKRHAALSWCNWCRSCERVFEPDLPI